MTRITLNYTGSTADASDGARVDPFDFEDVLKKADIEVIVVKGEPPDEVKKALADLALMGHLIEYQDE